MMIDFEERSYLAGFLDGEGCFYSTDRGKIQVRCSNTDKRIIEHLHQVFGGSMRADKKAKPHHKQCWSWGVVSRDARNLCEILVPFLRQKQEEAGLLIAIHQTMGMHQGKHVDPEALCERKRLAAKVKEAKR